MASKFAKEEEVYFSSNNYDSDSEDECNNSKSSSGSSSPTATLETRVYNDFSRSGGPCADQCPGCGRWITLYKRSDVWKCDQEHTLCSDCFDKDNCPIDGAECKYECYGISNGQCYCNNDLHYVGYTCGDHLWLCDFCYRYCFFRCPWHPQCPRKPQYYPN